MACKYRADVVDEKAIGMVRSDQVLHRKSSERVQTGEPDRQARATPGPACTGGESFDP